MRMSLGLNHLMRQLRKSGPPSPKHIASPVADENFAEMQFDIVERCNRKWKLTKRGARLTFLRSPVIGKNDRVMTIGSCFALEIRKGLRQHEFGVLPDYAGIDFDLKSQKIGQLPDLEDVNHYDTFTIRAEFERAFAGLHYEPDDFVRHVSRIRSLSGFLGNEVWQDPYRRHVFATSRDKIMDLSRKMDECIKNAIEQADVYVITPGVTEVWRKESNGYYVNQAPAPGADGSYEGYVFERSSYMQNYENLKSVCSLLARHCPEKKIILTVSPVPLKRTYSENDIIVANMESKSILRAVAADISREFENVLYWPSYEIVMARDMFQQDGRHVLPKGVEVIVDRFLEVHSAAQDAAARPALPEPQKRPQAR